MIFVYHQLNCLPRVKWIWFYIFIESQTLWLWEVWRMQRWFDLNQLNVGFRQILRTPILMKTKNSKWSTIYIFPIVYNRAKKWKVKSYRRNQFDSPVKCGKLTRRRLYSFRFQMFDRVSLGEFFLLIFYVSIHKVSLNYLFILTRLSPFPTILLTRVSSFSSNILRKPQKFENISHFKFI